MDDIITIEECITRLDTIRHDIVPNSRDHFALSAGIAALYEMQKDAPAVNRWISCSERLPENFVWCLVCMSDGCIRLGKWNGEYDEQGVWWVSHPNSGGKLYRIKNVPFWMLLPEPPEKE